MRLIGRGRIREEEPVVANEPVAMAEHESESESEEQEPTEARVYDALHEYIDRLAGTAKAGLDHGKPDLHTEYQECRDQSPHRVQRVHDVGDLEIRFGGETSLFRSSLSP